MPILQAVDRVTYLREVTAEEGVGVEVGLDSLKGLDCKGLLGAEEEGEALVAIEGSPEDEGSTPSGFPLTPRHSQSERASLKGNPLHLGGTTEMVPRGKSIVTGWSGHPMTLDLIDLPDDEVIGKAREDIELMIPGFSNCIEEATVFRHPYGVARYPTGSYRRVLDFLEQAGQLKGVSFVSDLFGGSYMEPAMTSAAAAVGRVCEWGGTA